jgi:hypothetical protein
MRLISDRLRIAALWLGLCGDPALAEDWPHWRGPRRDDVIAESSRWDQGGWQNPPTRWRASVGEGSSSPLVIAGRVYTLGWADGQDYVRCLDADSGRVLWQESYRAPQFARRSDGDKGFYSRPSATPEFDPVAERREPPGRVAGASRSRVRFREPEAPATTRRKRPGRVA